MVSVRDRNEFVAIMTRELKQLSIGQVLDFVAKVMRAAKAQDSYATALCNREVSERETTRNEKMRERTDAYCKEHGITCHWSQDPRGAGLKLVVPSGLTTDWGREGVCVPS